MRSTGRQPPAAPVEPVAWHDAECGSYGADLGLWEQLAAEAGGPVLELGAGTGRVSLHLARLGHRVVAIERQPELVAELERRAAAQALELTALCADLAELSPERLPVPPALLIGPMHVLQSWPAPRRRRLIEAAARLLSPGGLLALAVIDESYLAGPPSATAPLVPDVLEIDGWVYSSEPLWVQVSEEALTVRRLRQRVSPGGELERTVHDDVLYRVPPAELERMAADLGLGPRERRTVRSGPAESDSVVVLLEAR